MKPNKNIAPLSDKPAFAGLGFDTISGIGGNLISNTMNYNDLSPIERVEYHRQKYATLSLGSLKALRTASGTLLSDERKAALDKAILEKERKQAAFRMKTGNDIVISLMLN